VADGIVVGTTIPARLPSLSAVTSTPAVAAAVSAVIMEDPSSTLPLQKCSAAELGQSESVKRNKGRKHSAIDSMASSMDRLAAAFIGDGPVASPERKRQAIQMIEEDDDLSENECIRAYQIIRKDTTFADTVLSICKKETRIHYIKHELYRDN